MSTGRTPHNDPVPDTESSGAPATSIVDHSVALTPDTRRGSGSAAGSSRKRRQGRSEDSEPLPSRTRPRLDAPPASGGDRSALRVKESGPWAQSWNWSEWDQHIQSLLSELVDLNHQLGLSILRHMIEQRMHVPSVHNLPLPQTPNSEKGYKELLHSKHVKFMIFLEDSKLALDVFFNALKSSEVRQNLTVEEKEAVTRCAERVVIALHTEQQETDRRVTVMCRQFIDEHGKDEREQAWMRVQFIKGCKKESDDALSLICHQLSAGNKWDSEVVHKSFCEWDWKTKMSETMERVSMPFLQKHFTENELKAHGLNHKVLSAIINARVDTTGPKTKEALSDTVVSKRLHGYVQIFCALKECHGSLLEMRSADEALRKAHEYTPVSVNFRKPVEPGLFVTEDDLEDAGTQPDSSAIFPSGFAELISLEEKMTNKASNIRTTVTKEGIFSRILSDRQRALFVFRRRNSELETAVAQFAKWQMLVCASGVYMPGVSTTIKESALPRTDTKWSHAEGLRKSHKHYFEKYQEQLRMTPEQAKHLKIAYREVVDGDENARRPFVPVDFRAPLQPRLEMRDHDRKSIVEDQ
jgi:hypothetical protein